MEIIKIKEQNGIQAVSARELYEFLELDKTHLSRWMKENIEKNKFATQTVDYQQLAIKGELQNGGHKIITDYALSIDFAKKLCMISRSEKGEEARNYFIEVEKKYKELPKKQLPQNYLEALKELVVAIEHKEIAETKVKELQPKADVYDKTINTEGLLTVREVAKATGIGSNTLFKILRQRGKLFLDNGRNSVYQMYIDRGYFSLKIDSFVRNNKEYIYPRIMVTPKGLSWIAKGLIKEQLISQ